MEPSNAKTDQQDQQNDNQQQHSDDQQNQTTEDVQDQEIAALYEDEPAEPHMSVDQAIDGETSDQEGAEPAPAAKEKHAESDQPKDEPTAGQDQAAAQDTKPKDESQQQEPAQPKYAEPDGVFKIVGPDGAKLVSVKDMATTYQQYANLQQTHLKLKPTLDFVRQTNMPPDLVQPILAYGFAAYQRDMQSGNMIQGYGGPNMPAPAAPGMPGMPGTPGTPGMPGAQPAAYQGPFKDESQEAYFKERDPEMYAIIDNQRKQHQGVVDQLNQVLNAFTQLRSSSVPAAQQSSDDRVTPEQRQQFEKLINDWSGQYSDYFKPDEQGKNPNLDHFIAHLGRNYPNWKLEELTPERLTVAFSGFDSDYMAQQIQAQAKAKEQQLREQDRRAFGESDQVRTPTAPLQGQDKEIADLWDYVTEPN